MREDEAVILEGRIEAQTAKAFLIEFTNTGTPVWIPKSQMYDRVEVGNGLWEFHLSQWICKKNGL